MEKVDYTKRIPSNRRNIEAANRMVHADYDRGAQARHKLQELKNKAVGFDRRNTGIAQFARNVGKFQQAGKKYRTEQGLGHLESGWKSPYMRDIYKWLGNMGYNTAEFGGDVFELGWRGLGTLGANINNALLPGDPYDDFIPGDAGVGGEWWEMQKYNPNIETAFGTIPKPFWGSGKYDPDAATELQQAMGQAERASGLNLKNETDWMNILQDTNYQNHLRNYGLDLEGVKKEDIPKTMENFYQDKFYDQFSEELGTVDVGGQKYYVPQEWKDNYEGYTDKELGETFDKDFASFTIKESEKVHSDYQEGAQEKYNKQLMDQFGFTEDQLAYAESAMDPKKEKTDIHMGLWEDVYKEKTMPFMPDLSGYTEEGYPKELFEYETPEAQELAKSGWSTLPEWALYGPMFGGMRKASGILKKATEGTKAGSLHKFYENMYPGLSGKARKRSMWQFPATMYGASLGETGGE